ncbi:MULTISPECIES: hypothetical protein [unclassified Rathayibacter]|uniref:hypothetical protein n=1 Tax=unclassified Rathayibacter TaxID=2609250 RepID=UPI00070213F5|nr:MULTISPECIES: hypothetical protein [unclassified Rathayibacter]KQQ03634.1 hypothetical protein ASF42_09060 [Rathayibacter sp. Leaf294]KQS12090.1 hypothetical protein ASG06_09060 [Rathayibacter sp. Leaf185]
MARYRRLLGAALLAGALLTGALTGCSADHGRALDAALSVDQCVLESTTDSRPRPFLSRDTPAVFDVGVTASEECTLEQLTATAMTVAEAAVEALDGVPAWLTSSEYTQRVGDDVFAIADVHVDPRAVVAALEGWDALRRDVDGGVAVRTFAGDSAIEVGLAAGSPDTAMGVLERFLAGGTAISRGIPEWTITRPAGGGLPASAVVVHERPAEELLRLAREIEGAFTGATSMQLGATVLSFTVKGGDGAGRPLTDSALWSSVLGTMTAMTDRGSGYGIGGVVDAEAADGSGRVVDDFAAASTDCAAPPGGGATTRAAFDHLATVIRPAHPGMLFPQAGLSAPACR